MGALLHLVGNAHKYLDVHSTMIRMAENPRIEVTLKKAKSMWNLVPRGSGVWSVNTILGTFVILAASQIGQRPGRGASLVGSPGPVISFLSTICCMTASDL